MLSCSLEKNIHKNLNGTLIGKTLSLRGQCLLYLFSTVQSLTAGYIDGNGWPEVKGHTPSRWRTTAELVREDWEASSSARHTIWKSPMRAHRWAPPGSLHSLDWEWTVLRPKVHTAAPVAEVPHCVCIFWICICHNDILYKWI